MRFDEFSRINRSRADRWTGGSLDNLSLDAWIVNLMGELGEACNKVKKLRRLDMGFQQATFTGTREELVAQIADELADTFTYFDLVVQRAGLNLSEIVAKKFNEVSVREGFPERIEP